MRTLAYQGGKPIIRTPIKLRNSLGSAEAQLTADLLSRMKGWDLSGYLAGSERGGVAIQRLETIWSSTFGSDHSIAVNSATSGILAALAVLKPKTVHIPVMGMSAIAAVPIILGQKIRFYDVDEYYCIQSPKAKRGDVILAVNLFGHPALLGVIRQYADTHGAFLIEDNAQGLFATENKMYAGIIGHIGVWSGNVHKPLNAGELGMLTTDDADIAALLRQFINHGEVAGHWPGLNFRPTELTALLAINQLNGAKAIVQRSQEIAHGIHHYGSCNPVFKIAEERKGCTSAWYCLAIEAPNKISRDFAVKALQAEGLPCRAGYVRIDQLPAFTAYASGRSFLHADQAQDRMILVELCSLEPTDKQVRQIGEALCAVTEEIDNGGNQIRSRAFRGTRGKPGQLSETDRRSKESQS